MLEERLELDFFEMENKIRTLVSNIISPVINKSAELDVTIKNLLRATKQNEDAMSNFETLLQKSILKMLPADEFNKKIIDVYSEKKSSDTIFHMKIESLGSRVDFLNHQFSDLYTRTKSLEEIQKHLRRNFDEENDSIREFKENYSQKLSSLEIAVINNSEVKADLIEKLEKEIKTNANSIRDMNEKIFPDVYLKYDREFKKIQEVTERTDSLFESRAHTQDLKKLKLKLEHDMRKYHKESQREVHNLRDYLDKMLRTEISCGISDTLLQILDPRQIKKLIPVMENQLNQGVECQTEDFYQDEKGIEEKEPEKPTITTELLRKKTLNQNKLIEEKLQAAKEKMLQESEQKVTRLQTLKKLEVDELIGGSPMITSETRDNQTLRDTERQKSEQKNREEVIIEQVKESYTKESKLENKKEEEKSTIKVVETQGKDRETVLSSLQSEKSLEDYLNKSHVSLDPVWVQEQLNQLSFDMKLLQQTKEEIAVVIKEATQALKSKVTEAHKEFSTTVMMLNEESKQLAKQRQKDLSDIHSFINFSLQEINEKVSKFDSFDEKFTKLNEVLFNTIECIRVVYELIAQDEEDRKGLQLMGYAENKAKKVDIRSRFSVSLKPECLSCTGENPLVYSAFKMACLNYSPSDVKYNLKYYPRKALIEKLGDFMCSIWENSKESGLIERLKSFIVNDESKPRLKSHQRTRTASRYILDLSATRLYADPETPLHSKRDIRIIHK